jgi:hypothetical protein
VAKERSLREQLHIGEVDDDELSVAISSVLPRGAQFRAKEVEYRTSSDEWVLSLRYRAGSVVDAIAGPAMTPTLEERLRAVIEESLLTASERRVWRWTMFSGSPVEGYWRFRDTFQIVPAPPEAPRPGALVAEHPFVLDVVFDDSPDFRIRGLRWSRKVRELELVLNLVLRVPISSPMARHAHHWVMAPQGSEPPVLWVNEGYFIPGFQHLVDDMPDTNDFIPLIEVVPSTYFDPTYRGHSDSLTIPTVLEDLIQRFGELVGDDRARFLRACRWYQLTGTVWSTSQSLHLTCLINAIECLATVASKRSEPEGPSRLFKSFMRRFAEPEGPSRLFKSFMRRFAPGEPSGSALDKLYDIRSEITHGERLMHHDLPPRAFGLNERSANDRHAGDDAIILCRGALLNWLWTLGNTGASPLVTVGLLKSPPAKPGTKGQVKVIFGQ